MWKAYCTATGKYDLPMPVPEYFDDNEQGANILADLVVRGIKQATCSAVWTYRQENEPIPMAGELWLVTNWAGEAQCILETTQVDITPFIVVSAEFAALEGEGDRTLAHWRNVHERFFRRQFEGTPDKFDETMPLVCQQFKLVYP